MNRTIAPLAATIALLIAPALPSFAQSAGLPATVMGKFVHQPGDNQYGNQAQRERHAPPPQAVAPVAAFVPTPGWQPTPRPFRPDPSLEPIAADEPVSPSGFPPLPDRLDLPVSMSWGSSSSGGGGSRGVGPTGGIDPNPQGMHQHYNHYQPGAFMPGGGGGGGGGGQGAIGGPSGGGGSGYYKCQTPPPIGGANSESFATNPGMGGGNPLGGGTGKGAISAAPPAGGGGSRGGGDFGLGKEPKLNAEVDSTAPPQAVTINQATTQDLSLPEDEFQKKATPAKPTSAPNMVARGAKRVGKRVMSRAYGMGQGMMSQALHF